MVDWTFIQQVGLPIALVIFFVLQDKEREKRMSARLDTQQDYIQGQMMGVIEKNAEAMNTMAKSNQDTSVLLKQMSDSVDKLECLKPWDGKDRRNG